MGVPEDQNMAIRNKSNNSLGEFSGFSGFYSTRGSINDSENARDNDFKAIDQDIISITISSPN